MLQQILIKFEGEEYKAEVPTSDQFTGSIALAFHFFQGKLMKSEVSKSSQAKMNYELSTAQIRHDKDSEV